MAAQIQAAQMRLERLKVVSARTGLPACSIYRKVRAGEFPKPCKISERSSAWDGDAVDKWIAERIASASGVRS